MCRAEPIHKTPCVNRAEPKKVSAKNIYADLDYPGKFYWKDIIYGTEKEVAPYNGKIIILVNEYLYLILAGSVQV